MRHAALSDVGLRRANNQDAFAAVLAGSQADFDQRGHLFMVADGMGAHAAGELASKIATDVVPLAYHKLGEQSPPEALRAAILDANHQINSRGQASADFRGMGTTACALALLPAGALVAHVGDSRAYRLRGHRIEQLTFDHSLVWEMQASGQLSAASANHVPKNIITRSLGPNPVVQVDLEGPHPLEPGDIFLLCSDGLSGQVRDDEMGAVLRMLPPEEAVRALVDLACLRGGPDNITVIVVHVLGPQIARSDAPSSSLPVRASNTTRPIHPLVWTLLGVALLGAAGLLALEHFVPALISFGIAAAAVVLAYVQRYGKSDQPAFGHHLFGGGPYVACDNTVTPDLLGRFAEIAQQLRDAAVSENWIVEWGTFDRYLDNAAQAVQRGDLSEAAREHLLAVMSMMAQLRQQRKKPDSDSSVFSL